MAVEERYVVRSLTGMPINPEAYGPDQKPTTEWYVMDTVYCYRVVACFRNARNRSAKRNAEGLAKKLNREEHAWERSEETRERRRLAARLRQRVKGRFA